MCKCSSVYRFFRHRLAGHSLGWGLGTLILSSSCCCNRLLLPHLRWCLFLFPTVEKVALHTGHWCKVPSPYYLVVPWTTRIIIFSVPGFRILRKKSSQYYCAQFSGRCCREEFVNVLNWSHCFSNEKNYYLHQEEILC